MTTVWVEELETWLSEEEAQQFYKNKRKEELKRQIAEAKALLDELSDINAEIEIESEYGKIRIKKGGVGV